MAGGSDGWDHARHKPRLVRIFAGIGKVDSTAMWRVLQPLHALSQHGFTTGWSLLDDPAFGIGAALADVVILEKTFWPTKHAQKNFMNHARKHGTRIVFDVDDDVFSFSNPLHEVWARDEEEEGTKPEDKGTWRYNWRRTNTGCIRTARAVDCVAASVPVLAGRAREAGARETRVRPNLIDLTWWRKLSAIHKRQTPGLTVGWAGAKRAASDLEILLPAWRELAKRAPHVTFVTAGHEFPQVGEAVGKDRWRHYAWMSLEAYPLLYMEIDVGCAPLAPNRFNWCKSPIKVMEYAAAGAAAVASPTVYDHAFPPESGATIARTSEEWSEALFALVTDEERRRDAGDRLRRFVEERLSLEGALHLTLEGIA